MIKKLVVFLFIASFGTGIVLAIKTDSTKEVYEDIEGSRIVLEDFSFRAYQDGVVVKRMGAKLGSFKENFTVELFSKVYYSVDDAKVEDKFCDVSSEYAQVRFDPKEYSGGFMNLGSNTEVQYAELDSAVNIRLAGQRLFSSEKILFKDRIIKSLSESRVEDPNTSIYSKNGFLYDIDTEVLSIDSHVTGKMKQWLH